MTDDLISLLRFFMIFVAGFSCGYAIGYPIKKSDDRKLAELEHRIREMEQKIT